MSTSVVVLAAAGEQMIILKMIMMSLYTRRPFIILGKHRNWRAWPHQEHTKNDHLTFIMNSLNDGLKTLQNNKIAVWEKCQNGILRHISTEIKLYLLEVLRNKLQVIFLPNMIFKKKLKWTTLIFYHFYINWWLEKKVW